MITDYRQPKNEMPAVDNRRWRNENKRNDNRYF